MSRFWASTIGFWSKCTIEDFNSDKLIAATNDGQTKEYVEQLLNNMTYLERTIVFLQVAEKSQDEVFGHFPVLDKISKELFWSEWAYPKPEAPLEQLELVAPQIDNEQDDLNNAFLNDSVGPPQLSSTMDDAFLADPDESLIISSLANYRNEKCEFLKKILREREGEIEKEDRLLALPAEIREKIVEKVGQMEYIPGLTARKFGDTLPENLELNMRVIYR